MPSPAVSITKSSESEGQLQDTGAEEKEGLAALAARPPKMMLLKHLFGAAVMLLLLFWANSSWLMGKMYQQSEYVHRLHVLAVDLDGGPIGSTLTTVATSLSGEDGPTYDIVSYTPDETLADIWERVREGSNVWGAVVANRNASSNLSAAILSSLDTEYDASSALTILYNEARYRTVELSYVYTAMVQVVQGTISTYQQQHGAENIVSIQNSTDRNAISAVLGPIGYTMVKDVTFSFPISVLLNTALLVFPVLSQFFVIMAANNILGLSGVYETWSVKTNRIIRAVLGFGFSCMFGLSWASWLFIFKDGNEGSHLVARHFFYTWLTIWLYAAINFQIIDGLLCIVEMKWAPFIIFSLIMTQVASALSPMDLASNFYRVDYFFPAHHIWEILMVVYGNGATNHLKINLPVAFVWLLVATSGAFWANTKRFTAGKLATGRS